MQLPGHTVLPLRQSGDRPLWKVYPPTHMFHYVGERETLEDNKYHRFPNRRCRTCIKVLDNCLLQAEPPPTPFRVAAPGPATGPMEETEDSQHPVPDATSLL